MGRIVIVLLLAGWASAQSQGLTGCTGQASGQVFQGGASTLQWSSLKRQERPATADNPAMYVFERRVDNRSDRAVTDILWKVAGFEKKEIPAHQPECDFITGLGDQFPHPKGDLYYGVGASSFPTQVYAPEGGFGQGREGKSNEGDVLDSSIEITDPLSKKPVRVWFRASVAPTGKGHRYDYTVTSSATDKIQIYWYIPLTEDFRTLEMNRQSPLRAAPNEPIHRQANSSDPVAWAAAVVQIFDFDHRWIATGRASVYCSLKGVAEPLLDTAPGKLARDIQ